VVMHEAMPHDQAIELLPWLVNDSLDAEERRMVADHATSCVICRRELGELQALQSLMHDPAAESLAPAPDMRRINARIDAQLAREAKGSALLSSLRGLLASPFRVAFAAQTVALVVVAAAWLLPRAESPEFETMTSAEQLPAGHYLRVVFDPTIESTTIERLLDESHLAVVAGPSERGVYTLQFANDLSPQERSTVIDGFGSDARVLFAQPVEGGGP